MEIESSATFSTTEAAILTAGTVVSSAINAVALIAVARSKRDDK